MHLYLFAFLNGQFKNANEIAPIETNHSFTKEYINIETIRTKQKNIHSLIYTKSLNSFRSKSTKHVRKNENDEPENRKNRVEWKKEKKKTNNYYLFASMYCNYPNVWSNPPRIHMNKPTTTHTCLRNQSNWTKNRKRRQNWRELLYNAMSQLSAIVWAKWLYSWFSIVVQFTERIAQVT